MRKRAMANADRTVKDHTTITAKGPSGSARRATARNSHRPARDLTLTMITGHMAA
jgi:hypothetical protein